MSDNQNESENLEDFVRELLEINHSLNKQLNKRYVKIRPKAGRPSLSSEDRMSIVQLRRLGRSCREISALTGFGKSTVGKYIKQYFPDMPD